MVEVVVDGSVINGGRGTEILEEGVLRGRRGGGHSEVEDALAPLDCERTHAAGSCLDENLLAGSLVRHAGERFERRL